MANEFRLNPRQLARRSARRAALRRRLSRIGYSFPTFGSRFDYR